MPEDNRKPAALPEAGDLLPLVYEELRRLARHKMSAESPNQTLQPTALVHEAYLRLISSGNRSWQNPRYFFAAAAEAMRRILIETARRRQSLRRGGGQARVDIDDVEIPMPIPADELMALDAALTQFAQQEPEKAELVKLKFFGGFTTADAAKVMGISEPTAKRYWAFSRAWLFREVNRSRS